MISMKRAWIGMAFAAGAALVLTLPSGGRAMGDAPPPPCYGNHPEAAFWGGMLWDDADWWTDDRT